MEYKYGWSKRDGATLLFGLSRWLVSWRPIAADSEERNVITDMRENSRAFASEADAMCFAYTADDYFGCVLLSEQQFQYTGQAEYIAEDRLNAERLVLFGEWRTVAEREIRLVNGNVVLA